MAIPIRRNLPTTAMHAMYVDALGFGEAGPRNFCRNWDAMTSVDGRGHVRPSKPKRPNITTKDGLKVTR